MTILIAVSTAGILIWQVILAVQAFKADHERRRKQATIEHLLHLRPLWHESRRRIDERWGTGTLHDGALQEIDNDTDAHEAVKTLLGHLEHLAVGVNAGVFDKDLVFRGSAAHLIKIYHRMYPYIDRVQKTSPTAYCEFRELVKEFEKKKHIPVTCDGDMTRS